ncbi:hypothetical protein SVIOM342S_01627 [Streptomyces violaceorubidus]
MIDDRPAPEPGVVDAVDACPYLLRPRRLPGARAVRRAAGGPRVRRAARRGHRRAPAGRPGRQGAARRPRHGAGRGCHGRSRAGGRHRRHMARQRGRARPGQWPARAPGRPLPGRFRHEGRHRGHRPAARRAGPGRPGRAGAALPPRPVHGGLRRADQRPPVTQPHQRHPGGRRTRRRLRPVVRAPLRHPHPAGGRGVGDREGAGVRAGRAAALPQHQLHDPRPADRGGDGALLRRRGHRPGPAPGRHAAHVLPGHRPAHPGPAQPGVPDGGAAGRDDEAARRDRVEPGGPLGGR